MKLKVIFLIFIFGHSGLYAQNFELKLSPELKAKTVTLKLKTNEENYKALNDKVVYEIQYNSEGQILNEYNFYFLDVMEYYTKKNYIYKGGQLINLTKISKDEPRTKRHFEMLGKEEPQEEFEVRSFEYSNGKLTKEFEIKESDGDTILNIKKTYDYDDEGRIEQETNYSFGGRKSITEYKYKNNQKVLEKSGDGFSKEFSYNDLGQLIEIKKNQFGELSETLNYVYSDSILIEEFSTYSKGENGLFKEYRYNENKVLRSILWKLNRNDQTGLEFIVSYKE